MHHAIVSHERKKSDYGLLFAVVRILRVFGRVVVTWALFAFIGTHARAFVVDVTRVLAPRCAEKIKTISVNE